MVNILPPLETEDVKYVTIAVEEDRRVMRALEQRYAGIGNVDGTLNFAATVAWMRHLTPQWLKEQWRAWRYEAARR